MQEWSPQNVFLQKMTCSRWVHTCTYKHICLSIYIYLSNSQSEYAVFQELIITYPTLFVVSSFFSVPSIIAFLQYLLHVTYYINMCIWREWEVCICAWMLACMKICNTTFSSFSQKQKDQPCLLQCSDWYFSGRSFSG